ncbi:hypothetical protein PUN28_014354 [Cardiocondyla obscurior]|uniref:Uncharacterized protein n=1 Tax=Cardiocondyla obscurior TaxID=286306 RepID=A0AAW2F1B9_9HYME
MLHKWTRSFNFHLKLKKCIKKNIFSLHDFYLLVSILISLRWNNLLAYIDRFGFCFGIFNNFHSFNYLRHQSNTNIGTRQNYMIFR